MASDDDSFVIDEDVQAAATGLPKPTAPVGSVAQTTQQPAQAPVGNFRYQQIMSTYGQDPIMSSRSPKSREMVDYMNRLGMPTAAQAEDRLARDLADPNSETNKALARMNAGVAAYYRNMEGVAPKLQQAQMAVPEGMIDAGGSFYGQPVAQRPGSSPVAPTYPPVAAPSRAALLGAKAQPGYWSSFFNNPVVQSGVRIGTSPQAWHVGEALRGLRAERNAGLIGGEIRALNARAAGLGRQAAATGGLVQGAPTMAGTAGKTAAQIEAMSAEAAAAAGARAPKLASATRTVKAAPAVQAGLSLVEGGINMFQQPNLGMYVSSLGDALENGDISRVNSPALAGTYIDFLRGASAFTGAPQIANLMENGFGASPQQNLEFERKYGINPDPLGAQGWGEALAGMFVGGHTPGDGGDPNTYFTRPEARPWSPGLPSGNSQPFDYTAFMVEQAQRLTREQMARNAEERRQEAFRANNPPNPNQPGIRQPDYDNRPRYAPGYTPGPVDPNFQYPTYDGGNPLPDIGYDEDNIPVTPRLMGDLMAEQPQPQPQPQKTAPAKGKKAEPKQMTWQDYIVEAANKQAADQMKRNEQERKAESFREFSRRKR